MSSQDCTHLREILTTKEILCLVNDRGFLFSLDVIERPSGESFSYLCDDSHDGPLWHILLGAGKHLHEGFDLVCFRPTHENPYFVANEWNETHYKSVMTVMSDIDNNWTYVHPYFALRLCSTVDFQQLVTNKGFDRHLADWISDVEEATELFPYEPESIVGDGSQNSDI